MMFMRTMSSRAKTAFALSSFFVLVAVGILFVVYDKEKKSEMMLPVSEEEVLLGGDRDEHGCIGSAGYSWCEAKNKCLRSWEEECDTAVVSEVKDETTGWLSYKDTENGFVLKYPPTAELKKEGETHILLNSGAKIYVYTGKTTSVPLIGTFGGRFEYNADTRPDFMILSEIGGLFTKDYFAVSFDGTTWDRVVNAHKEKEGTYLILSLYNPKHDPSAGESAMSFLGEMRDRNNPDVNAFNSILSSVSF